MSKKNANTNTVANNSATNNTTSNNVVSNDKSSVSYNVFSSLSTLTEQRKQWEDGAYRKSNDELYALLQNCYELDQLISTAGEGVKAMRDDITKYAKQLGYSFQKSTPTITRIVRCVFGEVHRSRVSTYSLVLREAKSQKIAAKNIPSFISGKGGVQEIRLTKSPNYLKPAEKIAAAEATVFNTPISSIKTNELSLFADSEYSEESCVLLARQEADGSFTVFSVVRSKAAVDAAMLGALSASKQELTAKAKQDAISAEANEQAERINGISADLAA